MFFQSKSILLNKAAVDSLLAALPTRPAGPLFAGQNLHLFTNNRFPTFNDSSPSVWTEAAFTGYAAQAISLAGPYVGGTNLEFLIGGCTFAATAVVSPAVTVYGYFITDTTNAVLYGAELFPTPQSFALSGDFLQIELVLALTGVWNTILP